MPVIDWAWLEAINLFQVATVIVALYVLTRILVRTWPALRKTISLIDSLGQLPGFIERTDLTLQSQDVAIKSIYHETHQNDGSSIKDAVGRVEVGVAGLHKKVAELSAADEAIRRDLESTKPPVRKRTIKPKE